MCVRCTVRLFVQQQRCKPRCVPRSLDASSTMREREFKAKIRGRSHGPFRLIEVRRLRWVKVPPSSWLVWVAPPRMGCLASVPTAPTHRAQSQTDQGAAPEHTWMSAVGANPRHSTPRINVLADDFNPVGSADDVTVFVQPSHKHAQT